MRDTIFFRYFFFHRYYFFFLIHHLYTPSVWMRDTILQSTTRKRQRNTRVLPFFFFLDERSYTVNHYNRVTLSVVIYGGWKKLFTR